MENKKTISRRNFLKNGLVAVGSVSILSRIIDNDNAWAQTAAVDEASPTALALGYKHDANAVDVAKFTKRATPEGKKQFCSNCVFFTQGGMKADSKDGEYGKCTLFPTGLVAAAGWCNTWTIKPGVVL